MSQNGNRFRAVFTNTEGSVASSPATLTVVPAYALSIGNARIAEGDTGGTRPVTIPVVLSRPATSSVTVKYATASGSATAMNDFTTKSGTLTFAAGSTVKYVTVPVRPDTTVEPDESFTVTLSAPTGIAAIASGRSVGTVTILNDDGASGLRAAVSDVSIWEGNGGKPNAAKVLVTLSSPATSSTTVKLTLTTGTAGTADFKTWAAKTVTFKAGQFQHSYSILVVQDAAHEGNETATLTLSDPSSGVVISRSVGTLTILDDD
jgi:chitinase